MLLFATTTKNIRLGGEFTVGKQEEEELIEDQPEEEPVFEESVVEEPVIEEPVAEEPAAEELSAAALADSVVEETFADIAAFSDQQIIFWRNKYEI